MTTVPEPNPPPPRGVLHPKFSGRSGFQAELRRRVDAYFNETGKPRRDCPQLYLKTAILLAGFVGFYVLLVFFAQTWWQALPLAILLGLTTAGIGLNIQHDGGHDAFSNRKWVNRLMAMTLDLIGGSSFVWHHRHNVLHHTYVNITGHDTDIDIGELARITPFQKRRAIHRWQHYYMWLLYGFMAVRWQIFGDYLDVIRKKIGDHPIPRPKRWDLAIFLGGKMLFLVLALGIPMLFHPWWVVLIFYGVAAMVTGITLSTVFQLAHTVEEAAFIEPTDENLVENAWAIHQVESTVDFARRSRLAAWLMGGLNYQIEHHLFPRISHINYPAMSKIVEQTCREYDVAYHEHRTFRAGIASHFRWLRKMGLHDEPEHPSAIA